MVYNYDQVINYYLVIIFQNSIILLISRCVGRDL